MIAVHSALVPFAILIALTPGADTALVVRNALVAGATGVVLIGLGVRLALTRR